MTGWLFIVPLIISSSIDNLGVGMSYGIQKIRISFTSNFLIATVCFTFSLSGIYCGMWISKVFPGIFPLLLSFFVLIIIGVRLVLLGMPKRSKINQKNEIIETGNFIKEILQDPTLADLNFSKNLGSIEAIILGVVVSANALTNGIGAGLLGFSPFLISLLSAVGSFLTIWLGNVCGVKLSRIKIGKFTVSDFGTIISGIILLIIAVSLFLK